MSAIYRSLNARIEATMEDGKLFTRHLGEDDCPLDGLWHPCQLTDDEIYDRFVKSFKAKPHDRCQAFYFYGCLYHCLNSYRPSIWYIEPKSHEITRSIESLQRQLDEALVQEASDRPNTEAA